VGGVVGEGLEGDEAARHSKAERIGSLSWEGLDGFFWDEPQFPHEAQRIGYIHGDQILVGEGFRMGKKAHLVHGGILLNAYQDGFIKTVFLLGVVNDFPDGAVDEANERDFSDAFFYGLPDGGRYPMGGDIAQEDKDDDEDQDAQARDVQGDDGIQPLQDNAEDVKGYDGGKEEKDAA